MRRINIGLGGPALPLDSETLTVAGTDEAAALAAATRANPPELWDLTIEPATERWAIEGAQARGLQAFRITRKRKEVQS